MLAPKQHRNSGHKPIQQKQKKKPFKLKREGLNATPEVRAKLKIGSPNDKFEKEADSVADTVVNKKENPNVQQAPAPPVQTMKVTSTDLQRMNEAEEDVQAKEDEEVQLQSESESEVQMMEMGTEEDSNVQMKSAESETEVQMMSDMGTEEEPNVQMMSEESDVQMMSTETDSEIQMMSEMGTEEDSNVQMMPSESNSDVQMESESESDVQAKLKKNKKQKDISSDLKSSKGGGQKMDSNTQSTMEEGFGTDLSGVNIHTDTKAIKMNEEIGSKAFTNGADIYFNEGQYQPESKEGQTLLAHELTHTLQQGAVETGKQSKKEKRAAKKAEKAEKKAEKQEARQEKKEARQEARAERQAAKTEAKIEKAEIKAETKEAKKAEKAKKKEEKKKAKEEKKEEKKKPNPKDDPNFQAVMGNIKKEAHKQKPKDDPTQLGDSANEAAESPASEAGSLAMADQVEEMEKEEPKVFSAETFKEMLSERIESMQLPKNNEEADEFEDHNNIDEVNKAATKDVQNETASTTANIDQKTNEEPKVKPDHKREPEKLKTAKKGKKPKSVDAKKAIPPVRKPSEIEKPLADDTARLDNRMAEDNVTDNQLAISQEPKFENALDEKNKAKEESAANASTLRAQESGVRKNNAATAEAASKEELKGMQALNHSAVKKVTAGQNKTSDKDTAERDRVAGEINAIYDNTQKDVNKILEDLDKKVEKDFAVASKKARAAFEAYVGIKFYKYKRRRYSGIKGPFRWTRDLFMGLPDEVNRYFEEGRELFIEIMDAEIDKIAVHIANELNRATQRIEDGKQEVTDYVENLPKDLKKFGKEAAEEIQDKFDELSEDVNSKQDDLVDMLAEEYVAALNEVDERIEEMKAANRGLVDMVMDFIDGVLETIRKLKEMIQNLLSAIMSVIDVIMADPIGFMGMLFDGLAEGFENFKNNIQKHLLGGLLEWLTGSLGPMGITVPEDIFSLSGVFDLTLQVLGLGWDYIKLKAVRMMGQPMVDVLMTGFDMFKTFATEGAMGIWKYVKDKFQDLKATVIDAIKEMLITKVIEAGVKWLLSLLIPGAGFIKAIMAIKDIIVFFVESAIMLIPAITEAILALARGDIKGVAKAMEFGLAKLITLVIGLFAKLIGLGGLTKRVQKIFKKIRKRVDKAITKLLRKAKKAGRKLLRKLGIGKKKKKKNGKEEKYDKKGEIKWWDNKSSVKLADKTDHTLLYKKKGKEYVLMMQSNEDEFMKQMNQAKQDTAPDDKANLKAIAEAIKYYNSSVKPVEDKLRKLQGKTNRLKKEASIKKNEKEIREYDAKHDKAFNGLKKYVAKIKFASQAEPTNERTKVTKGADSEGRPTYVKADPLTWIAGNTTGSSPKQDPIGWDHANSGEREGIYIRGHMLNDNIHGPGVKWNLVPITRTMNTTMEGKAEKKGKAVLDDHSKVMYYETKVKEYHSGAEVENNKYFPKVLEVSWGELEYKDGKKTGKMLNEGSAQFSQGKPAMPYNVNDLGASLLTSKIGIDQKFAEAMNKERKISNFVSLFDLNARMKKYFSTREGTESLVSSNLAKIKSEVKGGNLIIE